MSIVSALYKYRFNNNNNDLMKKANLMADELE